MAFVPIGNLEANDAIGTLQNLALFLHFAPVAVASALRNALSIILDLGEAERSVRARLPVFVTKDLIQKSPARNEWELSGPPVLVVVYLSVCILFISFARR